MKHQYYADSRDVWKWTALVRLARQHALRTVVHVAMLTPDDDTSQGSQKKDPPDADPAVARFFAEERKAILTDRSLRRIDRVTRLGGLYDPPIAIEVVSEPFRTDGREAYFEGVCRLVERIGKPIVCFIDPDIGVAQSRPSAKHVPMKDLRQVWSRLIPQSLLVLFQFRWREKEWIDRAGRRFADALEVHSRAVSTCISDPVALLYAVRSNQEQPVSPANVNLTQPPQAVLVPWLMFKSRARLATLEEHQR